MSKSISVIIPNYNGRALLERHLPSVLLALSTSKIEDYELIVSDDASTDDSVSFLEEHYAQQILLIKNSQNVGFAGNVNRGISRASKELVFILNSDVQLTEGYFEPMLPYFELPDTFGVMSQIRNFQDVTIDQAKYPKIHFSKIDGTQNFYNPQYGYHPTFFLSGANALIDRKKLIELEGFWEIFNPFYFEDVDLGIRAWRKGYRCYYENRAVCYHDVSTTIKTKPSTETATVIAKNKIYLHYLHLSSIGFLLFFIKTAFKALFLHLPSYRGIRYFLKNYSTLRSLKQKLDREYPNPLSKIKSLILNSAIKA